MKAIKSSQVPKRENSFNVVIFCAAVVYITVVLIVIVVNKVLIKSDNRVSNMYTSYSKTKFFFIC